MSDDAAAGLWVCGFIWAFGTGCLLEGLFKNQEIASGGAIISGVSFVVFLIYLFRKRRV